ncbi:MAG: HPP family protein [Dehalogenimonas sp.]
MCLFLFIDTLNVIFTDTTLVTAITFAVAITLAMFLMAITNTEHPPAAATLIGLLTAGWSWQIIIFVLVFASSLAIIHRLLRRYLIDLF